MISSKFCEDEKKCKVPKNSSYEGGINDKHHKSATYNPKPTKVNDMFEFMSTVMIGADTW